MVIGIDTSVILGYYQAKAGVPVTNADGSTSSGSATPQAKVAPTPPWKTSETPKQASANVTSALAGHKLVDEGAAKLDLPGAGADYKKLFALYQGLGTLTDLVNQYKTKGLSSSEKAKLQTTFAKGLSEVTAYLGATNFDKLRLIQGAVSTSDTAKLAVAKPPTSYTTPPLTTSTGGSIPAFEGDVRFDIQVTRVNQTYDIPIDLAQMPDQTRSLANVVSYVNGQLAAAGVSTRFATVRIPGQPQTITAGSQTIKRPDSPDQWAMKVTVGTSETVSFSTPQTASAVYLAQQVGQTDPNKDGKTDDSTVVQQLLKFQTDTANLADPPQAAGQANFVDDRVFAQNLDASVIKVHAQAVGPDGALYVLADVDGTVAGQAIRGGQDVALLKYDSAGKLMYARTLGAAGAATGLGLAVSADGKVAVAGAVSGGLSGSADGALNSGVTGADAGQNDSFVTLFDAKGQEVWTQRRGARQDDQANQVAFGADGTVYVAGQTKSAMAGAGAVAGDWDSYVTAYATDAKGKVSVPFTQTFGTAGADKPRGLVIDGQALVVASVESGHAVLRRFDLSGGTPSEVASRDLGDLQGGDIAGLALDSNGQLVVAGTSANAALSAGAVTSAAAGGQDAFVARIAGDLGASAGDRLAYYGGAGDDKATALAVTGGQVWIAGLAGADLPNQPQVGTAAGNQDGFLANIDVNTGAVDWSRRFTGLGGQAAPTAIAAASDGASVLDRLGLPTGLLTMDASQQLGANSALRPGDQFTVASARQPAATVTIDPGETLDTLAAKIQHASGYTAKVSVVSTLDGQHQLKIEPARPGAVVTLGPGKAGANALPLLGLPEGAVRQTVVSKKGVISPADGKPNLYGLTLDSTLNLSDDSQVSHALAQLAAAQGVIRQAYKDLVTAATPKAVLAQQAAAAAANSGSKGAVPAYLTNQIANYQAALSRLTGGDSSASTVTGGGIAATLLGQG